MVFTMYIFLRRHEYSGPTSIDIEAHAEAAATKAMTPRSDRLAELEQRVAELEAEVAALRERLPRGDG